MQYVHHAGDPGVFAEGDHSLTIGVREFLEIQKTYVLLQNSVQERHIALLGLDGVRKEAVCLVRYQLVNGNLLDAENDRGRADVLLQDSTGRLVSLGGVRPSVAGLHDHLYPGPDETANVRRGKWCPSLPYRLVLPPYSYYLALKILEKLKEVNNSVIVDQICK